MWRTRLVRLDDLCVWIHLSTPERVLQSMLARYRNNDQGFYHHISHWRLYADSDFRRWLWLWTRLVRRYQRESMFAVHPLTKLITNNQQIAGLDFGCTIDGTCKTTGVVDPGQTGLNQMKHFVNDDGLNTFRVPGKSCVEPSIDGYLLTKDYLFNSWMAVPSQQQPWWYPRFQQLANLRQTDSGLLEHRRCTLHC